MADRSTSVGAESGCALLRSFSAEDEGDDLPGAPLAPSVNRSLQTVSLGIFEFLILTAGGNPIFVPTRFHVRRTGILQQGTVF